YWALYLERGTLAQRVRLYLATKQLMDKVQGRASLDAQATQLISARAAVRQRSAELVRAEAAVKNAETRIRGLTNANELGRASEMELLPRQMPLTQATPVDLYASIETALARRAEIMKAAKQMKAGCVRLKMANHEMMPVVNAVLETYVAGLRGDGDIGQSILDQYRNGAPSYSTGLQFEMPVGRRAAQARLTRRRIETRQLEAQYRVAIEMVTNEVVIAVREVNTAHREMRAKYAAMLSLDAEAAALTSRYEALPGQSGSAVLTLQQLLRAQQQVTDSENAYLLATVTYNLALVNLRRVTGTILEVESVMIGRGTDGAVPRAVLEKLPTESNLLSP
ncbi:MAG: TolC family protein, partial [Planctomycetota bacterium]